MIPQHVKLLSFWGKRAYSHLCTNTLLALHPQGALQAALGVAASSGIDVFLKDINTKQEFALELTESWVSCSTDVSAVASRWDGELPGFPNSLVIL